MTPVLLACRGAQVSVIPCWAVPDNAYVVDASYMGAPTVSIEKLDSSQAEAAAHAVLKVLPFLFISCRVWVGWGAPSWHSNTALAEVDELRHGLPILIFVSGC